MIVMMVSVTVHGAVRWIYMRAVRCVHIRGIMILVTAPVRAVHVGAITWVPMPAAPIEAVVVHVGTVHVHIGAILIMDCAVAVHVSATRTLGDDAGGRVQRSLLAAGHH